MEVPSRNKAYFEGKYTTVVQQVSSVVTAFLQRLDEDDNTNVRKELPLETAD
jgi:hypothetical protein